MPEIPLCFAVKLEYVTKKRTDVYIEQRKTAKVVELQRKPVLQQFLNDYSL